MNLSYTDTYRVIHHAWCSNHFFSLTTREVIQNLIFWNPEIYRIFLKFLIYFLMFLKILLLVTFIEYFLFLFFIERIVGLLKSHFRKNTFEQSKYYALFKAVIAGMVQRTLQFKSWTRVIKVWTKNNMCLLYSVRI